MAGAVAIAMERIQENLFKNKNWKILPLQIRQKNSTTWPQCQSFVRGPCSEEPQPGLISFQVNPPPQLL